MPAISTQSDLRAVQKLSFCYLCGNAFIEAADKTRDHVPPRSIFATSDRGCPLILPTHQKCNGAQSVYDEVVGQVIAAIHGKYPEPTNMRLDVTVAEDATTGTQSAWLGGANLHRVVCRWLRAFHAALYREYLPDNDGTKDGTMFGFDPPFPVGHLDKDNELNIDPIRPHHRHFVKRIKQNRVAGKLDRIQCSICTRAREGNRLAQFVQAIELLVTFGGCPDGRARQKKYGVRPNEPIPVESKTKQ